MNDFIIRPRRRWRWRYWVTLLALAALLLALWLFSARETPDNGWDFKLPWSAGKGLSAGELRVANAGLREKLLILEQNNQVDKQAAALLQKQLIDAQEENFQLRKDLKFYQGIIDVSADENSPIIHGLRIRPLLQARGYRLELILLHITNTDKVFNGTLDVAVEGVQDRAVKRLPLNGLSLDGGQDYKVRFRNFQRFEDNFILPETFEPQKVFVTLFIGDEKVSGFEKIFDWPVTEGREMVDVG